MGKVFKVGSIRAPISDAVVDLDLPVTPYELLDARDRLRLSAGDSIRCAVTEYLCFKELKPQLNGELDIYELNALAQKLSELDGAQSAIFAGLVKMEGAKRPIPLPHLTNLAYSTECCHIFRDALNDSQIGRIFVENGRLPGAESLPGHIFEMLDFEQIGRKLRLADHGVFVERNMEHPGGYVVRHSPLLEADRTLDLTQGAPDYTILLEVSCGEDIADLKLPATAQALEALSQTPEGPDCPGLSWRCLDCRVPMLAGLIDSGDEIGDINNIAKVLAKMDSGTLAVYKAVLEAVNCQDLLQAQTLAGSMDDFVLSPRIASPTALAVQSLHAPSRKEKRLMSSSDLSLQELGQALLDQRGAALTSYGMIERKDHRPVQAPQQKLPEGGMTLA